MDGPLEYYNMYFSYFLFTDLFLANRKSPLPSNPLVYGVVSGIVSQSRHKLLSTLSSIRRRDPQEHGTASVFDIEDVLSLHNVGFDEGTREELFRQFMVAEGVVDYNSMWRFVMSKYVMYQGRPRTDHVKVVISQGKNV